MVFKNDITKVFLDLSQNVVLDGKLHNVHLDRNDFLTVCHLTDNINDFRQMYISSDILYRFNRTITFVRYLDGHVLKIVRHF